jgi:hypothetical protein
VSDDAVRDLLRARGCPESVVAGGLGGLLEAWAEAVDGAERGWTLGLDDWLNELDARQLLAEALERAAPAERRRAQARLAALDERLRAVTERAPRGLWGERVAAAHGWDETTHWWYWALPRRRGDALSEDLGERR